MKISQHPLPRILSLVIPASLLTGAVQVRLAAAPADTVTVRVDQPGAPIPPTLFGLFFEDINFAADGGLYPERVKNRSFEFPDPLQGWRDLNGANGVRIAQYDRAPGAGESRYLHVNGGNSIANEGFRGMGVQQGAVYHFSVRAAAPSVCFLVDRFRAWYGFHRRLECTAMVVSGSDGASPYLYQQIRPKSFKFSLIAF